MRADKNCQVLAAAPPSASRTNCRWRRNCGGP